jgi:hypothetical protein
MKLDDFYRLARRSFGGLAWFVQPECLPQFSNDTYVCAAGVCAAEVNRDTVRLLVI